MNLYRFKTFRTTYYFPPIVKGMEFLYGLYTPYGFVSRIYWWIFRHLRFIRWLNRVDSRYLSFPYERIQELIPQGSLLSYNMGTPGEEQKISMLGLEPDGRKFFAKYSDKIGAIALSRNEIKVLESLKDYQITPDLLDCKIGDDFCFFRTSYVGGNAVTTLRLNQEIVDFAISINKLHIGLSKGILQTGLSHGDFSPWNMLIKEGEYKLIDWEMAEERPLGYDLFYFIYQVGRLFAPKEQLASRINYNAPYIERYFNTLGIGDWQSYYDNFKQRMNIV